MNERIRDLAEHCDFYVGNEHSDKSPEEQQRLWTEKLAELVVRQCCFELTQESMKLDPTQPMSLLCLTSNATDRMMKYFGVEK